MNISSILNQLSEEQIKRIFDPLTLIPLKDKINNHAYTALGIKTGDVSEEIVKTILQSYGAIILDSRQDEYDIDVYFSYKDKRYFIEMKIRDDHDSTKKRGQIENYNGKKNKLKVTKSCCWFIDPFYKKNKKYYTENLPTDELYYADEFVNWLISIFGEQAKNFYFTFINKFKAYKKNQAHVELINMDNNLNIDLIDIKILTYIFYYGDYNEIKETLFDNNVPIQQILEKYNAAALIKREKVKYVLNLMEVHKND